jgi:hypothetical protein
MNSKMRRIFQSSKGKFFAKTAEGKKVYGVKAMYRSTGRTGARKVLTDKANASVPTPIRRGSGIRRKTRSDKGGMHEMKNAARAYQMVFGGRRNPLGAGVRKVRKNKGVRRRAPTPTPNYGGAAGMEMIFGNMGPFKKRAVRKNKGVKRGPRARAM